MFNTLLHKISENKNNNSFYIKRDDLLPFSFGGNKARKALYFFDDIEKKNCDAVVTYGSSSSNHCRIISNIAASKHMPCYIISPEENFEDTANSKMFEVFGASIIKAPITEISLTIDRVMQEVSKNHNPYFIQGGGHGNLGTKAYVDAYEEICLFEKENNMKFDYIFHASGTGTTQAGLICAQQLRNNNDCKIVGISIARSQEYGKSVVLKSVYDYMLEQGRNFTGDAIFVDDYLCGGYAKYNQNIINVIKKVLTDDGIPLNTTYTGKAYYGMLEYVEKNKIRDKNILFINTGGVPIFFDKLEELK